MISGSDLRSDDFRHAWPTALQIAMQQVAELHQEADQIVNRAHEVVQASQVTAAGACLQMDKTAEKVIAQFDLLRIENGGVLNIAVTEMAEYRKMLQAQEKAFDARAVKVLARIKAERESLDQERQAILRMSFWQRLMFAIDI